MFKYLKTIGAHCGAPEPEYMGVSNNCTITSGSLCEMHSGVLTSKLTQGKSKFITLEDKESGDGNTKIKCMRVLPGMIFAVDFEGEIANIDVGTLVSPTTDSDGYYCYCGEGSGALEVVDTSDYDKMGKIALTIHC